MNKGYMIIALAGSVGSACFGMYGDYRAVAEERVRVAEQWKNQVVTEGDLGNACDSIGRALSAVSLAGHRYEDYARLYRVAEAFMRPANVLGGHRRVSRIKECIGRHLGLVPAPWQIAEEEEDFDAVGHGLHQQHHAALWGMLVAADGDGPIAMEVD